MEKSEHPENVSFHTLELEPVIYADWFANYFSYTMFFHLAVDAAVVEVKFYQEESGSVKRVCHAGVFDN